MSWMFLVLPVFQRLLMNKKVPNSSFLDREWKSWCNYIYNRNDSAWLAVCLRPLLANNFGIRQEEKMYAPILYLTSDFLVPILLQKKN